MERPKKSAVAGLLDDHLVEVLSRLPVKDLHRSKCVSKAWLDLITDPLYRKKLPQTLQGFFRSWEDNQPEGSFINLFGGCPPPIDPSLPFLKKLPGIHTSLLTLRRSCNGLLLFDHCLGSSYIVFNPATEQWAAVPSEHTLLNHHWDLQQIHLAFHPAVSSHFHLVVLCEEEEKGDVITVHSYSSKTGVWRGSQIDRADEVLETWVPQISGSAHATLFNGMVYLILNDDEIAEVDVEGKTQRIILPPSSVGRRSDRIFIGQSQGRLHCINKEWGHDISSELSSRVYTRDFDDDSYLLSVWVLEDNDTQKWVHKHSVSCARLFGSRLRDCDVIAIHPDSNLVFIRLCLEEKLISYGLDSKEVHTIGTVENDDWLVPYVPCFLDFEGGRKASAKDDGESSGR